MVQVHMLEINIDQSKGSIYACDGVGMSSDVLEGFSGTSPCSSQDSEKKNHLNLNVNT